ncbi:Laccase-2 [Vanrija pseudolonga]|uniref:Laccase-2 n=1 Tax=Vanrija pseudolonga TaxID=143232 RepID=A0AAF0Y6S9_9TREE|nr:Laccase-2 [Vanrija pseudolonga]
MRPTRLALAAALALLSGAPASASVVDKRWCFLWIFGDTCGASSSSTSSSLPPAATTSVAPSSLSMPPTSATSISTSSASATSISASALATAPSSPSPPAPVSASSSASSPPPSLTPTPSTTPSPTASGLVAGVNSVPTSGTFYSAALPTPIGPLSIPPIGSFFSYSQPPIPAQTASADPASFTCTGADAASINQPPQVRNYDFVIQYSGGSPDGFSRRIITINNQFPGPKIEANQGDTLVIKVTNTLDIPQSIHWHGMRQNGSNHFDGAPGIHQCPIRPGASFTYTFKLDSEVGTYWYHSHYGNTMADGLVGALIVHSRDDPLKLGQQYDEDRILYLSDWMDDQSLVIDKGVSNLFSGYRGLPIVLAPDAILVNGVGQVNCGYVQKGVQCGQKRASEVYGAAGRRIRFRLINTGSHAMIRFSIDNHVLTVIEADDTAIQPVQVNEVPVATAQRYSVVVTLNQGQAGSSFWIRARAAMFCINPLATVIGYGVIRYTDAAGGGADSGVPPSNPWPNLENINRGACRDLDDKVPLVPLVPENPPAKTTTFTWNSLFGVFIDRARWTPYVGFGMNSVAFTNYINNPLLAQIRAGRTLSSLNVASATFNSPGAVDFIINVLDPPPLSHPFHLHGRPFYILARGDGALSSFSLASTKLSTNNPLRRDVLTIPHFSWAVIRVPLDDPGVWPLHCHIGWHLAVGKLAAVVVRPDDIRKQAPPQAWSDLCSGLDQNEIGPARRDNWSPPQARGSHWEGYDKRDAGEGHWEQHVAFMKGLYGNLTLHAQALQNEEERGTFFDSWMARRVEERVVEERLTSVE